MQRQLKFREETHNYFSQLSIKDDGNKKITQLMRKLLTIAYDTLDEMGGGEGDEPQSARRPVPPAAEERAPGPIRRKLPSVSALREYAFHNAMFKVFQELGSGTWSGNRTVAQLMRNLLDVVYETVGEEDRLSSP